MPTNLTDDPTTFPSPIQVPSGTDPRTDTSVGTPFQQLANRSANTKARADAVVPFSAPGYAPALPAGVVSGVSILLQCGNLTQLASIPVANRTAGMLCLILGLGVYQYQSVAPGGGALANVVVIPADTIGAWILIAPGYGLFGQPNCIAQADGTGRTPAASTRNGLIAVAPVTPASIARANAGLTVIPGSSIALTLAMGDIVILVYSMTATVPVAPGGSSYFASSQLVVAQPIGSPVQITSSAQTAYGIPIQAASIQQTMASGGTFSPTNPGVHTFTLQTFEITGGNAVGYASINLLALQVRP